MPRQPNTGPRSTPLVGRSTRRSRAVEEADSIKPPALPLPHERDQTTRSKAHPVDEVIDRAKHDIDSGLQDPDVRGDAAEIFDRRWNKRRKSG
jgi:hypothetical protein